MTTDQNGNTLMWCIMPWYQRWTIGLGVGMPTDVGADFKFSWGWNGSAVECHLGKQAARRQPPRGIYLASLLVGIVGDLFIGFAVVRAARGGSTGEVLTAAAFLVFVMLCTWHAWAGKSRITLGVLSSISAAIAAAGIAQGIPGIWLLVSYHLTADLGPALGAIIIGPLFAAYATGCLCRRRLLQHDGNQ